MRRALRECIRFPEEWLDDLLETAPWQDRLAYAHTIARKLCAYSEYDYGDLSRLAAPHSSKSDAKARPPSSSTPALSQPLLSARVSVLVGPGRVAPVTASGLVARQIVAFADTPSTSL
jgi:hypothetical protein